MKKTRKTTMSGQKKFPTSQKIVKRKLLFPKDHYSHCQGPKELVSGEYDEKKRRIFFLR
jgi:hypothetical protein